MTVEFYQASTAEIPRDACAWLVIFYVCVRHLASVVGEEETFLP